MAIAAPLRWAGGSASAGDGRGGRGEAVAGRLDAVLARGKPQSGG